MTTILTELGKRLAEKWFSLLVLPGIVFVAVAVGATHLGHERWYALHRLPTADATPSTVVAALAAATVAGFAAQFLARLVEGIWLGEWRWLPILARPLTAHRRHRWRQAAKRYDEALELRARLTVSGDASLPDTASLNAARNRIALTEPQRPTWMADRLLAADTRIHRTYDLDLTSAWPRLWLTVPDTTRAELIAARERLDAATRLAAWGIMYLPLAAWWWPAALVAVLTTATACARGRTATAAYAELVESTVDLHCSALARALGIDHTGRFTPDIGLAITRALRKNT